MVARPESTSTLGLDHRNLPGNLDCGARLILALRVSVSERLCPTKMIRAARRTKQGAVTEGGASPPLQFGTHADKAEISKILAG